MEELWLADADTTRDQGRRLADRLMAAVPREGEEAIAAGRILLLSGPLGAGKTCLVQGLAEGLGVSEAITSPTFALAQHYAGRRAGRATALVHLDLYRLEDPAAADELFAQEEEEARSLAAVLAVEWPERLGFLPADAWRAELQFRGEGRRLLLRPPL
jgi:tRNA threonylcarbamoyladenosine biosynthesis protein TsaE